VSTSRFITERQRSPRRKTGLGRFFSGGFPALPCVLLHPPIEALASAGGMAYDSPWNINT